MISRHVSCDQDHNDAVSRLWDDYRHHRHQRVPIVMSLDEQFLLPLWNCTFKRYYEDINIQMDIQLKNQKWILENVPHDRVTTLPDAWTLCPAGWMGENEFFGAEVVLQENDYAWGKPLALSKADLLKKLQRLDVMERILASNLYRQYRQMEAHARNMEFCGRPVKMALPDPAVSTHGIFTKAAELRGLEPICMDMYDDALFVKELLETITVLTIARIKTWHSLIGSKSEFPSKNDWGICDDSLTMVSRNHYMELVLPCHEKLYSAMTTGERHIHLCGQVQHLFATLHHQLGITTFNGPGPQIDLIRMINDIGTPVSIEPEIAHATLTRTPGEIEREVKTMLSEEVKQRARITLSGYAPLGTPLSNIEFFYQCGKKHGIIDRPETKKAETLLNETQGKDRI